MAEKHIEDADEYQKDSKKFGHNKFDAIKEKSHLKVVVNNTHNDKTEDDMAGITREEIIALFQKTNDAIISLNGEITQIKNDVSSIKTDIGIIKTDIGIIKSDVSTCNQKITNLTDLVVGSTSKPLGVISQISLIEAGVENLATKEALVDSIKTAERDFKNDLDKKLPTLFVYGLPLSMIGAVIFIVISLLSGPKEDIATLKNDNKANIAAINELKTAVSTNQGVLNTRLDNIEKTLKDLKH